MNKAQKYLFIFISLIFSSMAQAYVHSQTKSGVHVHWPSSSSTVDIYVNSDNTRGLLDNEVQSIAATSFAEWNGISNITIRKNMTSLKGQTGFNELYFTNDPVLFNGTAVVGITQVGYKEDSGEIVEADILINDAFNFSSSSTDYNFLGNVITHEAGHFLGLGHGQVLGSTMFYALSVGQHTISSDDRAGLYETYPSNDPTLGTITGTIMGGKNLIGVFGAHVQAISVKTGKVAGATISEINGHFSISGLPRSDQYLIYTSPIKQLGLPSNYASAKSDFCESSKKYRGSFFQSCGSSSEGAPLSINLNSSSVDVGKITVRCSLDNPPEYVQNKNTTPAQFDLQSLAQSGLGGSFVGFFSPLEMSQNGTHDYFRIDLSNVDWDQVSSSNSLYLEIKITHQGLYSPFKAFVNVKHAGSNYDVAPLYTIESDGRVNIDTVERLHINRAIPSDNDFEIKITPLSMDASSFSSGIPYSKSELLPSFGELGDGLYFYLVTATIVRANGDGTFTQVASKNDVLSDNTQCPDAVNTYALSSYSATGTGTSSERKKSAGCGTVEFDNGPKSGGPGGFMIGLLFCFIVSYTLSRYSKLA